MNRVHRQRRRNLLMVLAVAFLLYLAPRPKEGDDKSAQEHYAIAAHKTNADIIEAENTCISVMLLGCMGFMMATFYLVNWPDEDIRRISWEVISATISVFGSLLLLEGFNRVLEHYFFEDLSIWQEVGVAMLQLLLWFAMLQLVLGYQSGAIGEKRKVSQRRAALESAEMSSSPSERLQHFRLAERLMQDIQMDTHAAAVLMGHVTGFAAVHAWSFLQQAVPRTFWCCAAIPPLSFLGISWVYQATRYVRHKKTFADGEEDEYEVIWGEQVAETEDEVISLSVSFLAVQMLRFCISGHLPDAHGVDKPGQEWHSNFQCAMLLLAGVIGGGADVARLLHERSRKVNFTRVTSSDSKVSTSPVSSARAGGWFQQISATTFAFSLLFAAEWWISSNFDLDGSLKAVVSSLLVTCVAFVFIFGIDKVADRHFEDAELDQALRLIISALGMMIGFSWERCFDAALNGLSTRGQGDGNKGATDAAVSGHHLGLGSVPPAVCNLLMAVGLAVLVLPAWKWYILPSLHNHDHDHSEGSEASAHSARKGSDVEGAEEPNVRMEADLGDEPRLLRRLGTGHCGEEKVDSTSWPNRKLLFKEKRALSSNSFASDRYTPDMISI